MFAGEKKSMKMEELDEKEEGSNKEEEEEKESELPTLAVTTVMNLTSSGFDHSTYPSQV